MYIFVVIDKTLIKSVTISLSVNSFMSLQFFSSPVWVYPVISKVTPAGTTLHLPVGALLAFSTKPDVLDKYPD